MDATELRQSLAGQPRADISDLATKRTATLIKMAGKSTDSLHRMWLEQAEVDLAAGNRATARAGVVAIIREMRELGIGGGDGC